MEDSEKKKILELLKEIRSENSAESNKLNGEENRLSWMYKGTTNLIDREEYLLGRSIDKSFEVLNSCGNSDILLGRTSEQSNVPKKLLEKSDNTEQVDIAKKILEDPLYAIKQKELEARKKLLQNPVKLKQIKKMLEKNLKNEHQKNIKQYEMENLDFKIMKKLRKFNDNLKKKALKKILKSKSSSVSKSKVNSEDEKNSYILKKSKKRKGKDSLEDSVKRKKNKKQKKNKNENLEGKKIYINHDEFKREKKEKYARATAQERSISRKKVNKKYNKRTKSKSDSNISDSSKSSSDSSSSTCSNSSSDSFSSTCSNNSSDSSSSTFSNSSSDSSSDIDSLNSSDDNSNDCSNFIESKKNKKSKYKKSSRSLKDHIIDSKTKFKKDEKLKRNKKKEVNVSGKINQTSGSDSFQEKEREKKNKKYGLLVPRGSKPISKNYVHIKKYEKHFENKTKYVSKSNPKVLSEKEREKKLKEMMENAKLRKQDRERNLERHRKIEVQEEENKTYDADFLRRQTSYFTSQGTMADRIKSNINNIQRSNSLMDKNFARKQ